MQGNAEILEALHALTTSNRQMNKTLRAVLLQLVRMEGRQQAKWGEVDDWRTYGDQACQVMGAAMKDFTGE